MATESEEIIDEIIEAGGWFYYNAQFADLEISVTGEDAGFGVLLDGTTFNYVTDTEILGGAVEL